MHIQVRFFASLREVLGTAQLTLDTQAATVGGVRDELLARGGVWAQALARGKAVRASLNLVMAHDNTPLQPGCEVAFFPPVTGG